MNFAFIPYVYKISHPNVTGKKYFRINRYEKICTAKKIIWFTYVKRVDEAALP